MADLLTPEEVREIKQMYARRPVSAAKGKAFHQVRRICRDYLTLWDRNKELEALIPKRLIQRVGGTETGGP